MNTIKSKSMYNKIKNFVITVVATIILVGCGSGSGNTNDSQAKLQSYLKTVANNFLSQYGESSNISAMPVLAQCGNKAPISVYAGTMSFGSDTPIDSTSIFQIGSITKSFISVVLLQLASDPKYHYSLDQPIGQWLNNYPESWNQITSRQLLHMVSGIQSYTEDPMIQEALFSQPYTYHDIFYYINSQIDKPIMFSPGSSYYYSNTNYSILGLLIEKITGNSVFDEVRNRVINKLNLKNTYFPMDLPEKIVSSDRLVSGYFNGTGSITDVESWTLSWANSAGAIISTPEDINTYAHALYTPDLLLNSSQIQQLTSLVSIKNGQPIKQVSKSDTNGFGLGVGQIYLLGRPMYYYQGSTLGYIFIYIYDYSNNNMLVFAINSTVNTPSSTGFAESILSYMELHCQ